MTFTSPQKRSFYQRWGWAIIAATICLTPFAFYTAARTVQSNVNKVEDWLPKNFVETTQLAWFRKHFACDQFIVLSWEGCKLADPEVPGDTDDPRIERLAQLLVPSSDEIAAEQALSPELDAARRRYFKVVATGRRVVDSLVAEPLRLEPETAIERLQGTMIGPDRRQTCVTVTLTPAALGELKLVLGHGQRRIFRPNVPPGVMHQLLEIAGVSPEELRMGGPPVDNIAIDEEGERTLVRLAGLSGLLGLGLAWWSLRSVMLTCIVFFCGVLSAATSLGLVWLTGSTLDAILMSMPSLVYVLSISGAVHLVNYYRDAVRTGGMECSAERAVIGAWKPAFLCTITTAIGLLSLVTSEIVPIRKFGIYSASGVFALLCVVYFFLPAALHVTRFGKRWVGEAVDHDDRHSHKLTKGEKFWGAFGGFVVRNHGMVSFGCIVFIAIASWGLTNTRSSIELLKLFDSGAKILKDYAWLEEKLGKLVPMEIVVRFDSEIQSDESGKTLGSESLKLSFLERLETIVRMQKMIDERFGEAGSNIIGNSLSAASFAPVLPPSGGNTFSYVHRKAFDVRLSASREEFAKAGFLKYDPQDNSELWRISVRVAAFKNVDYGEFVRDLRDVARPVLDAHDARVRVLAKLNKWLDGREPAGARIVLWNFVDKDAAEGSANDDDEIITAHLSALLSQSRCKVFRIQADPRATTLSQIEKLQSTDAVVVLGKFGDAELQTIRSVVPHTIDARVRQPSVQSQLAATALRPDPRGTEQAEVDAIYTGVVPIVYKAQRALLNSLVESTFWSFLTITPIMMFVSRSFAAGLVAMLPNVLPVLVIFGGMGWLGIPLDIGSMMTASIALGVAVDDTIHYLARYREDLDHYGDRNQAIVATYQHCAIPTLQAAMISGLGLSVFAFSTFTPTQRFGWLMLTILVAGVISELVMLPALLAGPLGRVFQPMTATRSLANRLMLRLRYHGPQSLRHSRLFSSNKGRRRISRATGEAVRRVA
ncbi:MAG: MMPL family transporter [Pirellulaceae bacterium]|nr:MMPL family transporter [Pirellulaceae bacterium]